MIFSFTMECFISRAYHRYIYLLSEELRLFQTNIFSTQMCTDNTEGEHCDVCRAGYYGDPTRGTPEDCKPCACPLEEPSNNFASSCVLNPKFNDPDAFMCLDCAQGYTGERCER